MTRRFRRPLLAALSRLFGRPAKTDDNPQGDRRTAARSLKTKLPPHLLKDVGADDG